MTQDPHHTPLGPDGATATLTRTDDTRATLALTGRFDAVEAPGMRALLAAPDVRDTDDLTIDLAEITFIDSAGLAALARVRRERLRAGQTLTLVRPRSEAAFRVFRLTKFDEVFTLTDAPEGGGPR